MHIVEFTPGTLRFLDEVPQQAPREGFVWIYLDRESLPAQLPALQSACQRLGGSALLDLHVKDLVNRAHPSHYDYTSVYDLVVFRRLATAEEVDARTAEHAADPPAAAGALAASPHPHPGAGVRGVRPAAGDVQPGGCLTRTLASAARYLADAVQSDGLAGNNRSRLPASPSDLMLRMVNVMVDGYLELRRELTRQLDQWQQQLLAPRTRLPQLGRPDGRPADAARAGGHLRGAARRHAGVAGHRPRAAPGPGSAGRARRPARARPRRARTHPARGAATCGAWSRAPRPRCRSTSRRRATAPTTSCAR